MDRKTLHGQIGKLVVGNKGDRWQNKRRGKKKVRIEKSATMNLFARNDWMILYYYNISKYVLYLYLIPQGMVEAKSTSSSEDNWK